MIDVAALLGIVYNEYIDVLYMTINWLSLSFFLQKQIKCRASCIEVQGTVTTVRVSTVPAGVCTQSAGYPVVDHICDL